jgi:hypothetical protein
MSLPPPWEIRESSKYPGRCYYFNNETQESSWFRPMAYPGNPTDIWPPALFALHILVKYDLCDNPDPLITRTREEAHERAKTIWAGILKGRKLFGEVAKQELDDTETRDVGGEIGWIKPKKMPQPFDDMAWKLKIGEMSPPILTQFGWHLILRRG